MQIFVVIVIVLSLLSALVDSTTTITSATSITQGWWEDDYVYRSVNRTELDEYDAWVRAHATQGDQWNVTGRCRPSSACRFTKQSGGTEDRVWGFFDHEVWQESHGLIREFECTRESEVSIEVDIYFCLGIPNPWQGHFYDFVYVERGIAIIDWTISSIRGIDVNNMVSTGGRTQSGTKCTVDLRKTTYKSRKFLVAPGQKFLVQIRNSKAGASPRSNPEQNAMAFNNVRVHCRYQATARPTKRPTGSTAMPTSNPSQAPSVPPTNMPSTPPTESPLMAPTMPPTGTRNPSKSPSQSPSTNPTRAPSKSPTLRPSSFPSKTPTLRPTSVEVITQSPTANAGPFAAVAGAFDRAFTGSGDSCTDGWIACNIEVFIFLVAAGFLFLTYWIVGVIWYKRRQNNRSDSSLSNANTVQMGVPATSHITSGQWKSAWELEQEQKNAQTHGQDSQW